jgi:phospholipase/carboxylesterase
VSGPSGAGGHGQQAFVHRWAGPDGDDAFATVIALHGTGGDETSLVPLVRRVAPHARILGIRGRSSEEGVTRYFRRFDALRYDQDHLRSEATALAAFVRGAVAAAGDGDEPVVAIGYSNGANIALAAALLEPGIFSSLALLRPVQPLDDPPRPDLRGTEIALHFGTADPYYPAGSMLPEMLTTLGAAVEPVTLPAGHALVQDDVTSLAAWYAAHVGPPHP